MLYVVISNVLLRKNLRVDWTFWQSELTGTAFQSLLVANSDLLFCVCFANLHASRCFTNVLIAHVPLDDKDRMHRKVFNLLQLAILPPSLQDQDNASPYRKKAIVSTSNDFSTGLPIVSSEQDLPTVSNSNTKGSISGNTGPLRGKSSLSAVNYGPSSNLRNSFEVSSNNNSLSKSSILKGPAFESLTVSNANNKLSELEVMTKSSICRASSPLGFKYLFCSL